MMLAIACAISSCAPQKVVIYTIDDMPKCAQSVAIQKKEVRKFASGKTKSLPKISDAEYLDLLECVELLETGYADQHFDDGKK